MPTAKPRTAPRPRKKVAENPLQAEAKPDELDVAFQWRGQAFTFDPRNTKSGFATYKMRVVLDESASVWNRANAAVDAFEAILGKDLVARMIEVEPTLFDDVEVMTSVFEALNQAAHGGSSGESSAS
jgi:hypothetical protein